MLWILSSLLLIQSTNSFTIGGGLIQPYRTTTCSETKTKILLPSHSIIRSRGLSYKKCNKWKLYSTKEDSPPPLPNTEDPYLILGLSTPTADVKVIKRAYRRMALKYHPDVRINANSTEREKKIANDDFAKINAAYAMLTGKGDNGSTSTSSGKGSSTSSSSNQRGKYSYTPPHRRTGQSTKSSYDWEDFMPKYDEEQYDTNGDSFGAIFSDLFSELGNSAAGGKGGGASILNDFVSFLEGNFPSVGNTQQNEEDVILNSLLKDGSFEEIKNELDDAKLLVKQLEGKQRGLIMELEDLSKESNNFNQSTSYMDQMRLEERRREVEARKEIVEEYLDRARVRQIKLKRRYEEMKLDEELNSNRYQRSTQAEPQRNTSTSDDEDAWKRESFGSSGRSRGRRSRSRPSSSQRSPSSSPSSSSSSSSPYSSSRASSSSGNSASSSYRSQSSYSSEKSWASNKTGSSSTSTRSGSTRKSNANTNESILPPHRRITSRLEKDLEDKRRLREIKVDEEIDKMKKELGL